MSDAEQLLQVEANLKVCEERLRMIVEATDDAIWDYDPAKGTIRWTPQTSDLVGEIPGSDGESWQWWVDHIHPDDRKRVVDSLQASAEGTAQSVDYWTQEYRYERGDGEYAYIANRAYVARDDDGKATRIVGVIQDFTERRREDDQRRNLEAQIQQAQKLESLGVLAGGIAHDFNNLLMGILGNADLALNELPAISSAAPYVERIQATAMRAADLCKQMLAYSGKGKFVVTSFSLNELVEDMVRLLEVSISKSAILNFNLSEYLPPVEGDLTQIRQVIMNLVTNASEAIGDKSGVITITSGVMEADSEYLGETFIDETLASGVYVYLEVSDTGCGMNEETIAKMFDPFYSTKFSGRGLGLAAVLGIVRGHQGAMKVYSQPRRGTTMKVLFPCSDQPLQPLEKNESLSVDWRGSGTILVVDDEETVRTVAKQMLEHWGFTVLTATDGRAAVRVFRSHMDEIKAVLLDMTMPHLGGEETFRELRRLKSDVRVAMMSGYNEQDVTSRFAGKGLAGFIQKPFGQRALAEKMQEVLEERTPVKGKTILVIEDDRMILDATKALLEGFKFKVLTADSGRSGVEALKENAADVAVVLLDFGLPDMHAEALFRAIRRHSGAPVILMTGNLQPDVAESCRDLGFAETLEKPLPMETLLNLVQKLLKPDG